MASLVKEMNSRLVDDEVKAILNDYLAAYDHNDDNSMWFNKLKEIADKNGYASDMKAYKANPGELQGVMYQTLQRL